MSDKIERGHVCEHGIRWPHPCQPCDDAAWEREQARRMTNTPAETVERVAAALAQADGLNWAEQCGYEISAVDSDAPEECDSSTCVAAHFEDHDPAWARDAYRQWARAAIAALTAPAPSASVAGETENFECADCPMADPGDCMKVGHCEHRDGPKPEWRCFHCGEVFTDRQCAERHFGRDEGKTPACIIKGADGGLLRALRDAENQADEAIALMHSESTDVAKAYGRATARHTQALMAAEEAGYEKGLADGRAIMFQQRVAPWMQECFGPEISTDRIERGDRLLEEVFELLQSGGYDPTRVTTLRDYVWGRPVGEPAQEVGGVMVTLAAYCLAFGLDMHEAGEIELARILRPEVVEKIRAKQAAKAAAIGNSSPLPIAPRSASKSAITSCRESKHHE